MMRHNYIRNIEAELMKEVCQDVKIEPELIPLGNNELRNGNVAEKARLDVSGIGIWGVHERTFLDVRIMHPNSSSYMKKDLSKLYLSHENEKKRMYAERVLEIEKGSFTPIILSTSGGMGTEAEIHHKRIAHLIADKKKESYADVISYIRTRIRFSLLKSTLIALRGVRGKSFEHSPISEISFNLIPNEK